MGVVHQNRLSFEGSRACSIRACSSMSIMRRGGLKQELFQFGTKDAPQSDAAGGKEEDVQQTNDRLLEMLQTPKVGRDLSAALWSPEMGAAELVLARRNTAQSLGFKWRRKHWLHIEEAVFLVDRADLMLFVELQPPSAASSSTGQPARQRQRQLLSLQECFELMVLAGVSMERYIAYSMLSKSGYLLMRYPSCWVLPDNQVPSDLWGHGAWAGCAGLCVPRPLPAGQALGAHLRSLHQGRAPASRVALAGEEEEGGAEERGAARLGCAGAGVSRMALVGEEEGFAEGGGAGGTGADEDGVVGSAEAGRAGGVAANVEVLAAGPDLSAADSLAALDNLQGGAPPAGKRRRVVHEGGELQPMQTEGGGLQPMERGDAQTGAVQNRAEQAPAPHVLSQGAGVAAVGGAPALNTHLQGGSSLHKGNSTGPAAPPGQTQAGTIVGTLAGAQAGGQARVPAGRGWWPCMDAPPAKGTAVDMGLGEGLRARLPRLAPLNPMVAESVLPGPAVSSQAHLVYDVYKPGAHVARSKRVFPLVACHVAMSSSSLPRLQEMRFADSQALSSTVPVKWAAVHGGITTMYELGTADLLTLM